MSAMNTVLNFQQMMMLEKVIHQSFHNVEITNQNIENQHFTENNQSILSLFISSKKVEGCSEKSLKYYFSTIDTLFKKLSKKVTEISTNDLRFYLSDYQESKNSSKVTIDNIRRIFSSFFSFLEDEDYILKSPVRRIHKVKTPRIIKEILSDEEIEILRDNCKEIRDLTLIEILSSTGIRVGELVKINRKDIDFHERSCIVTGKGNKEREVYFDARTKIHLKQYLKTRTDDNEALFVSLSKPHQRLSIGGVENVLRKLGLKTQINKVHPHKFRRTLATMAIDKGMPIEQVQKLLGHVKIDTTLHYAMVNQSNVKIAHRKFIS
ncbi:site-specific tyrosine recombinase/integron integrase [Chryseobacterium carnipullorum]|nr:site-specific tyrosine recombinase/integron integrase [Chryseobacterium carnipullorum]